MKSQHKKIVNIADHLENATDWFQGIGTNKIIPSAAEVIIRDILKKYQAEFYMEVSFRGLRYSSGNYGRFDFWLPDIGVLIEYDGEAYHDDNASIQKDGLKDVFCRKQDISLIRYNKQHYYNLDKEIHEVLALARISEELYNKIPPLKPRKSPQSLKKKQEAYKKRVEKAYKPVAQGGRKARTKEDRQGKKPVKIKPKPKPGNVNITKEKVKHGFIYPQGMSEAEYRAAVAARKKMWDEGN